ncbi:endolytic transglycosylase MltG [Pseudoflavonifractor phocaeensis]|uniref:endolytic transglycosylase MltG n=1 Tax=Pseudoflavonifractor phocaeensis TaxID=1870988 RepID=UPI001F341569|nr:endolytic transglycosylase MltG [Pseudoflavonifractor phocaeensis]MCF2597057.1 endolytic transglycosylase MltG [Pseudoflavonifractor phocaeensis]
MASERRSDTRRESRGQRTKEQRPVRRRRSSTGAVMGFAALYVIMVIGVSILLACVGWIAANDVLALNKEAKETTVTISKEDSFNEVASLLKKEGLIEYKSLFKLFASITGGKDKVVPGTYTLNTDMDYRALLSGMSINSSTKAEVTVTIPEGYSVAQIFQLLEDRGVSTVEELTQVASEHDYNFSFLKDIPLGDAKRLEGFLYPDTYQFNTPHSALYVINKMLVNFDQKYTDELRAKVAESGYSIREILTIASLIEKETDGSDRTKIASVIYNRLNNPNAGTVGFLQIDATLAYLNGGKVPTEEDKAIDSPYNTYKYKGLPPAPIANPGLASIQAALNPESTNYFYYALGDDNVHHYFKSYEELQRFLASQDRYKK